MRSVIRAALGTLLVMAMTFCGWLPPAQADTATESYWRHVCQKEYPSQPETQCVVFNTAREAAFDAINLDGSGANPEHLTVSWQLATKDNHPAIYNQYVAGWDAGKTGLIDAIAINERSIKDYEPHLDDPSWNSAFMIAHFKKLTILYKDALPLAIYNAQVAANRIALLYADFTPQANGVQVTPKVDGVTEVPGTSKLVDGVIQSTIEIDGYQFTYVSGHNDFKTYIPPTTPSPPEASAKKLTTTPTPKISGTVKVGKTLTAKAGTWKPSGVKLSYQWYRNGKKIDGATKSSYKLVGADKSKKVTVKVTGSKSGYKTVTKTSKATKKVATGTLKKGSVKITGSKVVGSTLTVTLSKWTPEVTAKYQWYRGSKKIKGATKASYTLTKSDKSKKIKVKVKVTKSGYKSVSKTAKAVKIK